MLSKIQLIKIAGLFKTFDAQDTIIISSVPRGGSTWLMEILNSISGTTICWEPLHVNNGIVPAELNLGWRPYIPEDDDNKKIKNLFDKILTGKALNKWTVSRSGPTDLIFARQLIVKFVRANLALPWLTRNYTFRHKPIYLVRHPVAVALSQIKAFNKNKPPDKFQVPDTYNNKPYEKHLHFLNTLKTKLEMSVALWCIENEYTLNHSRNGKSWILVCYEDLLLEPEKELKRIANSINISLPENITDKIREPSSTNFGGQYIKNPEGQLTKWRDKLTKSDQSKLQDILNYFGVNIYSCHDFYPVTHTNK